MITSAYPSTTSVSVRGVRRFSADVLSENPYVKSATILPGSSNNAVDQRSGRMIEVNGSLKGGASTFEEPKQSLPLRTLPPPKLATPLDTAAVSTLLRKKSKLADELLPMPSDLVEQLSASSSATSLAEPRTLFHPSLPGIAVKPVTFIEQVQAFQAQLYRYLEQTEEDLATTPASNEADATNQLTGLTLSPGAQSQNSLFNCVAAPYVALESQMPPNEAVKFPSEPIAKATTEQHPIIDKKTSPSLHIVPESMSIPPYDANQRVLLPTPPSPSAAESAGPNFMVIQTTPSAPEHERKLLVRSTRSFLRTLVTQPLPIVSSTASALTATAPSVSEVPAVPVKPMLLVHGVFSNQDMPSSFQKSGISSNRQNIGTISSSPDVAAGDNAPRQPPRVHFAERDDYFCVRSNEPIMSRTDAVLERYADSKPHIFCSSLKIPKDPRNGTLGYQPLRLNDVKKQFNTGGAASKQQQQQSGGTNVAASAQVNTGANATRRSTTMGAAKNGVGLRRSTLPENATVPKQQKTGATKAAPRDKTKLLVRPPKSREVRFDRETAGPEAVVPGSYPLAWREPDALDGKSSEIAFITDDADKKPVVNGGESDRSQFLVRLHVPDLTYTKIFHTARDARDRRTAGDKRLPDKYPYKLPDEYEDFADGDSVLEFAKRRFKQWFTRQMRSASTGGSGRKQVRLQVEREPSTT